MRRRDFLATSLFGSAGLLASRLPFAASLEAASTRAAGRKILIAGGNYNTPFIRYMAQLTGKARPKLLYLPTASADSDAGVIGWYRNCAPLNVEPSHQISFIESLSQKHSWEEVFLSVDGIVCS